MARISTYTLDGTVSNTDKVIGTDSENTTTKNFKIQDLKEFIYAGISGNMTVASNGTATTSSSATLTTARNIGGVSFNGSTNITLPGVDATGNQDTTGTAAIATTITVADESSDTTCFPIFATAATGDLAPKSGSNLTFNSSSGALTASNFVTTSDKRLKSEIQPIKEGLEIIKQFTSYNYIKDGEKESGFIAQEVQKVLPHNIKEDYRGYLSMSDRGVLAHMHKAILELEEKLVAIEEKLK
tara:strand:- start:2546 stop:3271 length:726 start_codon:yes stop_codon:yes gene_type:complete